MFLWYNYHDRKIVIMIKNTALLSQYDLLILFTQVWLPSGYFCPTLNSSLQRFELPPTPPLHPTHAPPH